MHSFQGFRVIGFRAWVGLYSIKVMEDGNYCLGFRASGLGCSALTQALLCSTCLGGIL